MPKLILAGRTEDRIAAAQPRGIAVRLESLWIVAQAARVAAITVTGVLKKKTTGKKYHHPSILISPKR
jgi:hypothetical protein